MTHIGKLYIISAASGSGKTSLVQTIVKQVNNLVLSISYTTRAKRPKEQEGIDYFFVSKEQFLQMRNNSEFLESAEIFGNYYGTSKKFVIDQINQGLDIILEIDYQGAKQVKQSESHIDCLSIFILPPSLQILSDRLTSRGQDDTVVIKQRLDSAKIEMQDYINYDYVIINDNFDQAILDLSTIIYAERLTVVNQQKIYADLISSLLA